MSDTTISKIDNSNSFGQWKDRTNAIIDVLAKVVTIGNSEVNTGNIVINGDITGGNSGTLRINTIDTTASSVDNLISVNADMKLTGVLQVNSSAASEIKLYNSNTLTWTIGTNSNHTEFTIKNGTAFLKIGSISGTTGLISGSTNLKLDAGLLPTTIASNTTGNAATATAWATGRTISLTGDVTGTSPAWTGSENISFVVAVADDSHNHVISNIDDLSTTLDGKLSTTGGTMSGNLLVNTNVNVQLGNTTIRRGTFGSVTDAFSITTTGTNVDTYISLPASTLYIANGTVPKTSVDNAGNIVTVGNITAFGSVSDITRKENVVKISNALDKIKQVSGYTYNYIGDDTPMTGVVAQEFEEVLPEVVYETVSLDGTTSKAVRHGNIVGLLIEAIKELEAKVEELRKNQL